MQDAYAHALYSTAAAPQRLLLRLSALPPAPGAPPGASRRAAAAAVCRLPATHAFRGLSDFQVVGAAAVPLDRAAPGVPTANAAAAAEPGGCEVPLRVLPPLFSVSDTPFKYGYKGFAKKDVRTGIAWAPAGKQTVVAWDAPCPPPPAEDDAALALVRSLTEHLTQQPWLHGTEWLLSLLERNFVGRGGDE